MVNDAGDKNKFRITLSLWVKSGPTDVNLPNFTGVHPLVQEWKY